MGVMPLGNCGFVGMYPMRRLEVKFGDDVPNTAIFAQMFSILNDHKVTLITVRSVGMQTEQAYLDLVEREESRGFACLYKDAEAA
jgi:ABC-2 type transport system ATP-binding protein